MVDNRCQGAVGSKEGGGGRSKSTNQVLALVYWMKNIELTQPESKERKLPLTEMIVEGENEMRAASRLFALLNSNGARRLRYRIETALVSGVKSVLRQVVGRQILRLESLPCILSEHATIMLQLSFASSYF